jgi:hypothetical protein
MALRCRFALLLLAGSTAACSLLAPSDAELTAGLGKDGGADVTLEAEGRDTAPEGEARDSAVDAEAHDGVSEAEPLDGAPDAEGQDSASDAQARDSAMDVSACEGLGSLCMDGACCSGTVCFVGRCATCAAEGDECFGTPCCAGICHHRVCLAAP